MSKDKSIVVKIDGKRLTSDRKGYSKDIEKISRDEIAAAEDSSEDRIHTYTREYDITSIGNQSAIHKINKFDMFKPIIIAIASALIVGSILGFVMLKVIVNFDNSLNSSPAILVPDKENGTNNNDDTSSQDRTLYTIEPLSAFVIQGGIFSTLENANKISSQFNELGYSPFVWEKDNQFFLLVQVGEKKEDLQEDINFLTENGLDVYGKEWVVDGKEIQLTKQESEWITSFQQTWVASLNEGKWNDEKWNTLFDSLPEKSDRLTSFQSELKDSIQQVNEKESNHILLSIWADYQSIFSN
ncbi:hypothetical protein [Ornithinibacillus halotolerans]|uniref:SPOR domain-containing protein n=1 Tax=Ornithinibacillus halotolerans TaxID=1274357 RepID=A0A916WCN5_9BACI|nr:hypothetical protein [Ornithinibacillus halotolerans]GGA85942.1 hypothetical protein GCM10008025_31110 [Ornithinibacillus halotolerans]